MVRPSRSSRMSSRHGVRACATAFATSSLATSTASSRTAPSSHSRHVSSANRRARRGDDESSSSSRYRATTGGRRSSCRAVASSGGAGRLPASSLRPSRWSAPRSPPRHRSQWLNVLTMPTGAGTDITRGGRLAGRTPVDIRGPAGFRHTGRVMPAPSDAGSLRVLRSHFVPDNWSVTWTTTRPTGR